MSEPINTGGAAFPHIPELHGNMPDSLFIKTESGMTLRAYIATKAMAGMINAEWSAVAVSRINPASVAKEACAYADALISELSKKP